jgi:hypothetical protein
MEATFFFLGGVPLTDWPVDRVTRCFFLIGKKYSSQLPTMTMHIR